MRFILDAHIHSRFAGACSKDITLSKLEEYARIKGVDVLGTGDFTHPVWQKEIKAELEQDEKGILWSKNKFPFILQTEISLMYSQGGRGRRIHHVVLAPNLEVVDQITELLGSWGRLDYDGRPIFGKNSIEFTESLKSISKDIEIIPAHCMTPWFGLYGSKSGFDSLEECFEDQAKHIHAVETGISADPPMLWRFSHLDKKTLISFSDLHSFWPWRLGREASIFDCKLEYKDIINAIRTREGFVGTIEAIPSYGKYHYDGHRACNVSFSPEETKKLKGICPKCKKPLTIGVDSRIQEVADRPEGFIPKYHPSFIDLIPLTELIAYTSGVKQLSSKKVSTIYDSLVKNIGNEFKILLEASPEKIAEFSDKHLADAVLKLREGKVHVDPGYDGVYGKLNFENKKQSTLSSF